MRRKIQAVTAQNIETIVRMEEEDENRKSSSALISEWIGSFAGTLSFIAFQLLAVAIYIGVNSGANFIEPFDPYPFPFLAVVLGVEGVLLMSFVLIRQNSMSDRADRRSHLALQINLLAEQEVTKALQMLQTTCRHLGVRDQADAETVELSKDTAVESLSEELRANLDKESDAQ